MPALAWAAAVVVIAGAVLVLRPVGHDDRPSGVLRGHAATGAAAVPVLLPPGTTAAGGLELRWRAVAGADHSSVRVYSGELCPLAAFATAGETLLVLPRGAITRAAAGDTVLWRVIALRDEAPLSQSPLGTLRVP